MFADTQQPRTPRGGYRSGRTPNKERPNGNCQTPTRNRSNRTPNRERPGKEEGEGNKYGSTPIFDIAQDFPELPKDGLAFLPRGRKDRRSAWEWDEAEGCSSRPRSLSRTTTPQRERHTDDIAGRGRARSYSESEAFTVEDKCGFQIAPPAEVETAKEAEAPTITPSICNKARESLLRAQEMEALRAAMMEHAKKLAALELEAQGKPNSADLDTMAEEQVSQVIESAKDGDSEAAGRSRRRSGAKPPTSCVDEFVMKPPASESWDFPMSRDEKKARVVLIDQQVATFEIEDLEQEKLRLEQDNEDLKEKMEKLMSPRAMQ